MIVTHLEDGEEQKTFVQLKRLSCLSFVAIAPLFLDHFISSDFNMLIAKYLLYFTSIRKVVIRASISRNVVPLGLRTTPDASMKTPCHRPVNHPLAGLTRKTKAPFNSSRYPILLNSASFSNCSWLLSLQTLHHVCHHISWTQEVHSDPLFYQLHGQRLHETSDCGHGGRIAGCILSGAGNVCCNAPDKTIALVMVS